MESHIHMYVAVWIELHNYETIEYMGILTETSIEKLSLSSYNIIHNANIIWIVLYIGEV